MYRVIDRYGKELCKMSTYERAELWLMHYEETYGLRDLKIVKEQ